MPSDDLNEQELQFKKRARRRLVGALALVLLMMIILPLVLDDRANKAPAEEIAINIAGQDESTANTKTTTTETDAEVKTAQGFNSKVVPIENTEIVELSTPEKAPEQAPVQTDKAAENPLVQAKTDALKVTKTEPKVNAQIKQEAKSSEPKHTTPQNLEDKKAAQAKEDKNISDKKTANSAEHEKIPRYMVQIGVFSDAANVKKLEQKLSEVGFKSRTEKIQTDKGEKIRLSTGPFGSKSDAENALARMKQVGLAGMIRTI